MIPWKRAILLAVLGVAVAHAPAAVAPWSALVADEPAAEHWAYRPLAATPSPLVGSFGDRARSPIDRFVERRLLERGLRPSAPADRRTLLRRVHLDLIGLPPAPEDLDAFLADRSPDAYERVVDRLLASPRHGERQARRWMDIVHFAETHGHDQDRPREHAWPYRDYLIRSFNRDTPYGRFVEEQVAGDALFPGDPWAIVATGFLAAGPWDESSLRDIRPDSTDRAIGHYLDRDDVVATTMSTFASSSVHCARCHDHKFDPISQRDYYGLQAVFAGIDKANRAYDADPDVARRRRELTERRDRLGGDDPETRSVLLAAETQRQVDAWEGRTRSALSWEILRPIEWRSESGATLTALEDGSLLAGGLRPETDTYTIVARTGLGTVTAVRLEVLTHESLPHGGPGRQENGNLHLSELVVRAAPLEAAAAGAASPVALRDAVADFDQEGWTVAHAIDGDPDTAWGVHPAIGAAHVAVFPLADALSTPGGAVLTFELRQLHGRHHLIGRPRLSATAAEPPFDVTPLPRELREALARPAPERSEADRVLIARHVLLEQIERELAVLSPPRMVYCGTNRFEPDGTFTPAAEPRPVHLLERGDISRQGQEVGPGTISVLRALPALGDVEPGAGEGARRASLARWLSDRGNALAWRSIANRIWHDHFGRGLVSTLNDFGRLGSEPSHPGLLDRLAADLLDHGGSIKWLHRAIVTSATWRQSSEPDPSRSRVDGDNVLFWRANRRRLDAETLRDSVLAIAGTLDTAMGGPSVKQFIQTPGVHVTPRVDYLNFDVDAPANHRRSVYRFIFRTLPDPFMEALDCPDASRLAPTRSESITAVQALATLNDKLMVRQSEHLADRLRREAGDDPRGCIRRASRLLFGRAPEEWELTELARYASTHGLANACRVLFNTNEFMFVD